MLSIHYLDPDMVRRHSADACSRSWGVLDNILDDVESDIKQHEDSVAGVDFVMATPWRNAPREEAPANEPEPVVFLAQRDLRAVYNHLRQRVGAPTEEW